MVPAFTPTSMPGVVFCVGFHYTDGIAVRYHAGITACQGGYTVAGPGNRYIHKAQSCHGTANHLKQSHICGKAAPGYGKVPDYMIVPVKAHLQVWPNGKPPSPVAGIKARKIYIGHENVTYGQICAHRVKLSSGIDKIVSRWRRGRRYPEKALRGLVAGGIDRPDGNTVFCSISKSCDGKGPGARPNSACCANSPLYRYMIEVRI